MRPIVLLHRAIDVIERKRRIKGRTRYWRNVFEKYVGDPILTEEQKRSIQKYYQTLIHQKVSTVFHEFYLQTTGNFAVEYLPEDLYYCYIDPYYNDWNAAKFFDNKCYYRLLLSDVQQPNMIACRINGFWYVEKDNDLQLISEQAAQELISDNECFVKQASESEGGFGVRYLEKGASIDTIRSAIDDLKGDIVVQASLSQSSAMARLNPSSVNTLRVLSFLKPDGSVKIYSVIVRMGIHGSKVDNSSSGGITSGVDENGRLRPVAYTASGIRFDSHPDTGVHFETCVIPNFDKVKEIVKKAHPRFSNFRLMSWDFAINEQDQPILIEVNMHYGALYFHQQCNGPLFAEDTQLILKEVFQ